MWGERLRKRRCRKSFKTSHMPSHLLLADFSSSSCCGRRSHATSLHAEKQGHGQQHRNQEQDQHFDKQKQPKDEVPLPLHPHSPELLTPSPRQLAPQRLHPPRPRPPPRPSPPPTLQRHFVIGASRLGSRWVPPIPQHQANHGPVRCQLRPLL